MSIRRREAAMRRLRALRRHSPAGPDERIAAIAADAGESVDDVLREVADFRLALETDLLIAAAALDADETGLAAGVLDDERAELADFRDRVLERLADAAASDELADRRNRLDRATRITRLTAAAATVVALVSGGIVVRGGVSQVPLATDQVAKAEGQFNELSRATLRDDTPAATVAVDKLHATLEQLIEEHGDDPNVADRIALLLTNDLALIKSEPELRAALNEAIRLVRQLSRSAPPKVRATVAPLIDAITPQPSASPKSTPKAKPSPSPSPSPSESPAASESPSSRSSDGDSSGNGPGDDAAPPLPTPSGL